MALRGTGEPTVRTPLAAAAVPAGSGSRLAGAVIGLAIAGVAAPIATAAVAAGNAGLWEPLAAAVLVGVLVLAPAGVGLAVALTGLRRLAALAGGSGREAENAVLRVFVATLLFACVIAMAVTGRLVGAAAVCLPLATAVVVVAWLWLLCAVSWPAAPPLRQHVATGLDIALLSGLLHFGGDALAGWYPLYLLIVLYGGVRRGVGALAGSAVASIVGFCLVIAASETWRQQPLLTAGLLVALALVPALVAVPIRALAAARAAIADAAAERRRLLRLIAEVLASERGPPELAAIVSPLDDILDLAALEAGSFLGPLETFGLRELVSRSLAPLRQAAFDKGMALEWRVDPRLPDRLHGRAHSLARILARLAAQALAVGEATPVRVFLDPASGDGRRIGLRLRVDGAADRGRDAVSGEGSLGLRLIRDMVALMNGQFALEATAGRGRRLSVTLSLAAEAGPAEPMLDLARRAVLVATGDAALATGLLDLLARWNAEARWVGDGDAALAELSAAGSAPGSVLLADARGRLLPALGLAHQVDRIGAGAPLVLLIVDEEQIRALAELDSGELAGFIPAPVSAVLLANALTALPPDMPPRHDAARPVAPAAPPTRAPPEAERITPIAAHPKFASEAPRAVDPRVVEGLRALGGGPGFLREVIETFRDDARRVMEGVCQAAAAADAAGFARGLGALHRAAGPLGGARLCGLTASLQSATARELRQQGAGYIQRLDAEIDRLAAELAEFVPGSEARRP